MLDTYSKLSSIARHWLHQYDCRKQLAQLLSLNLTTIGKSEIHETLQKRMLTPCREIKPFGGKYLEYCKIMDGHKYVCVDKLLEDVAQNKVNDHKTHNGGIVVRIFDPVNALLDVDFL